MFMPYVLWWTHFSVYDGKILKYFNKQKDVCVLILYNVLCYLVHTIVKCNIAWRAVHSHNLLQSIKILFSSYVSLTFLVSLFMYVIFSLHRSQFSTKWLILWGAYGLVILQDLTLPLCLSQDFFLITHANFSVFSCSITVWPTVLCICEILAHKHSLWHIIHFFSACGLVSCLIDARCFLQLCQCFQEHSDQVWSSDL